MQVTFGEFRLDLVERRLWSGAHEVMLAPKTLDLLIFLAKHPNRLFSREELVEKLWPGVYVDDHALSVQIAEARKALGDNPKAPRFIETRARRGYRFLMDGAAQAPVITPALPETRYAQSGEFNIAYQVIGSGPIDIVFVMGWVSHLEYFWKEPHFAAFLHRVAGLGRLILFDKRGTGLSDRVPTNLLPTLEQRMDDVRAVMDAAGSQRAMIFGVSEGGSMSALFAATYPEKTLGLVMFGCYARRLRDTDYPWGPTREERDHYCQYLRENWGGPVGIEDRAPTLAQDPAFREWWAGYLRMGVSPGGAAALTRMNAEIDVRPVLPTVRVPTLVLHRRDDRCLLIEEGRYLASRIPNSRFVELGGADHLPFVGDQDALFGPIEAFVETLRHPREAEMSLATVLVLDAPTGQLDGNIRREVEWFRGRLAEGGTPLATFDGPVRAIRCAHTLIEQGARLGLTLRASLHTGECDLSSLLRPAGYTVELTNQLLRHAGEGQIVVSRVVKDLVAGSGIEFTAAAEPLLTADGEPWPLFVVRAC